MAEVSQKYISEAIDNLFRLLGIKESVPRRSLQRSFDRGVIKECIKEIAHYLGLPIEINLSYVPSDYVPTYRDDQRFTTQALNITEGIRGNAGGITAQVFIPGHLPMYGTSGLVNFPINVKVSEDVEEYKETFFAIMAHELSHVVLYSLQYSQKDNELYTDIAAMLLGFNQVMKRGRKVVNVHEESSLLSTKTTTETITNNNLWVFV